MKTNRKLLYPKGYTIVVTSWENDGDNYNTKQMHLGDDIQYAEQMLEFCRLFKSANRPGDEGIGNIYDPNEHELKEIGRVFVEFYGKYSNFLEETDMICPADMVQDFFIDLAYNLGLSGGEFYTRVCEKVEVLYFQDEVYCTVIEEF